MTKPVNNQKTSPHHDATELEDMCCGVVDRIAFLVNKHPSQNLYHTDLRLMASEAIRDAITKHSADIKSENAQLRQALQVAHHAMQTWFSSEYLSHPITPIVGDTLRKTAPDSKGQR